jgi:hypothetical protein
LTSTSGADAPRGNSDAAAIAQPSRVDLLGAIDQIGWNTADRRDLAQAVGVGTVLRADNDDSIHLARQRLDGILAILRGVADVVLARSDDVGKPRSAHAR